MAKSFAPGSYGKPVSEKSTSFWKVGTACLQPDTGLFAGDPFEAFEGVGKRSDQEHQRRRLRIRFGPALLPFFKGSFIDPQFPCENSS